MKCPKCRKGRVKRLRTFDKITHVVRENKCSLPKCNHRFNTIELTQNDRDNELLNAKAEVKQVQDDLFHYANKHELLLDAVDVLMQAANERHAEKFPKKKGKRT